MHVEWITRTATTRLPSQWRLWLSDLTSLSPCEPLSSTNTSLWKDHYWCTLIQTVIICASCVAPYPLSLWCHCLCHKSHWAEHPMLQAFMWTKQISLYCFCESASTIPLFFFFNPLLKECHSCSANTEYVFMCIPSPVLIPSPISAWHTHSQPLLYRHMDKTETQRVFDFTAVHVHNLALISNKYVICLEFSCANKAKGEKTQLTNTTCGHGM